MSVVKSTKPDKMGTFGRQSVQCVFDGTTMQKLQQPLHPGADTYYCPSCGWVTQFITREGYP